MFKALRHWELDRMERKRARSNLCIQVENRADALAVARDRGCARVGGHARRRGDWKGGGKIILAKRYCSDLQSQVRPGENFL